MTLGYAAPVLAGFPSGTVNAWPAKTTAKKARQNRLMKQPQNLFTGSRRERKTNENLLNHANDFYYLDGV
jgi:hypothetical protein